MATTRTEDEAVGTLFHDVQALSSLREAVEGITDSVRGGMNGRAQERVLRLCEAAQDVLDCFLFIGAAGEQETSVTDPKAAYITDGERFVGQA